MSSDVPTSDGKTVRPQSVRNTSGLRRGGSPGRPKGVPNKVTTEARAACTQLVDDPVYRAKLLDDLRERKVAPAIECLLWYYAKGKPKDSVEVTGAAGGALTVVLHAEGAPRHGI